MSETTREEQEDMEMLSADTPMGNLREMHERRMIRFNMHRMTVMTKMMEGLPSWARDRDEDEWWEGGKTWEGDYTEERLKLIRQAARRLQYSPAGRNILQTLQDFTIGEKAMVTPNSGLDEAHKYWEEWQKTNKWDMFSKEMIRRLFRDGEVFIRFFPATKEVPYEQVRFVDPDQIVSGNDRLASYGIRVDDQDYMKVVYYRREWMQGTQKKGPEQIEPTEMIHVKILCDSDQKRGVSFFNGIGKYMKEYELWLQDRILLNRIRHIWNVFGEVTSPQADLDELRSQFEDVERDVPVDETKPKKKVKSGTVMFNRGITWKLDSLNINAADTKDDGRAIQLMIAIGTSFPEYIVRGDASNANYASTMVSESPFVKAMLSWQDVVGDLIQQIHSRTIAVGVAMGAIPSKETVVKREVDQKSGEMVEKEEVIETVVDADINFAVLLHRDIEKETKSVQIHSAEGWCSKRTASEKFGYDYDEELDQIRKEDELVVDDEPPEDDEKEQPGDKDMPDDKGDE